MRFSLDRALPVLERTPGVVRTQLAGLDDEWTDLDYGRAPDGSPTWSARQVVAHLVFGDETDWLPRARIIVRDGDTRPFDAFDRSGHLVMARERSLPELLDMFDTSRRTALDGLAALRLTGSDMERAGMHPALGPVTMGQLLAMWVVHDLNHIAQICKAMAFQFKDEVGPWEAYASILRPPAPR